MNPHLIQFPTRKGRGLLLLLLALLLTSCQTTRVADTVRATHDTLYQNRFLHDSIYVEKSVTQQRRADTIYIDRLRTEHRYRYQHDTCYVTRTDTLTQTITRTTSSPLQGDKRGSFLHWFSLIYTLASIPGLLILLLCVIKYFRR